MLSTLEAIFDVAVRYRRFDLTPVAGYRVPGTRYVAAHLETAPQMTALLEAAGKCDGEGRGRHGHGRALLPGDGDPLGPTAQDGERDAHDVHAAAAPRRARRTQGASQR
jgi:hypothetical protein